LQKIRFSLLIGLLAGLLSGQVVAQTTSNIQREKNWADQVVDTVVVGEPVWLAARNTSSWRCMQRRCNLRAKA